MNRPATLIAAVGAALGPALIVASIIGTRDALRTIRQNTYVHLSRYFWLYVAAPVAVLSALAAGGSVLVALAGFAFGLPLQWVAGSAAGLTVVLALAVDAASWTAGVREAMRNAHVDREPQRRAVLLAGMVLTATVVVFGAGATLGFAHLPVGVTQAGVRQICRFV